MVVSGDVAFSGQAEEYAIAKTDWSEVVQGLKREFKDANVYFVAAPGNHDCNLSGDQSVRGIVIERLREENRVFNDEVITTCAIVQKEFHAFLSETQSPLPKRNGNAAYWAYEIVNGDGSVLVRCYNTALTSTNPERPGQLTFPGALLGHQEPEEKYDFVVSVFHHPYNWLMPNIARRFREHVERTFDLILTGHEHEATSYRKYSYSSDGENDFLEGAVFQDEDSPETSGFNAVWIDLVTQQQKFRAYIWDEGIYRSQEKESHWTQWSKGGRLVRKDFQMSANFEGDLEDPGARFEHPGRPSGLRLEDIFVFPTVRELVVEGNQRLVPQARIEVLGSTINAPSEAPGQSPDGPAKH